jgi:hypothetical protein
MSARLLNFQPKPNSGSQHREHRSKKGRDPMYRLKRKARVKHLLKSAGSEPKKYDYMRWAQEVGGLE